MAGKSRLDRVKEFVRARVGREPYHVGAVRSHAVCQVVSAFGDKVPGSVVMQAIEELVRDGEVVEYEVRAPDSVSRAPVVLWFVGGTKIRRIR